MLIIAEKINIMSKTIGPAMRNREAKPIHELALAQIQGGARALDLNLGPATKDGPGMMQWLVKTVEEVTDSTIQLSLDTKNLEAMEAGLAVVTKHKPMINSTNADEGVLDKMMPLAAKYDADIIALAMTLAGIPRDRDERMVERGDDHGQGDGARRRAGPDLPRPARAADRRRAGRRDRVRRDGAPLPGPQRRRSR